MGAVVAVVAVWLAVKAPFRHTVLCRAEGLKVNSLCQECGRTGLKRPVTNPFVYLWSWRNPFTLCPTF